MSRTGSNLKSESSNRATGRHLVYLAYPLGRAEWQEISLTLKVYLTSPRSHFQPVTILRLMSQLNSKSQLLMDAAITPLQLKGCSLDRKLLLFKPQCWLRPGWMTYHSNTQGRTPPIQATVTVTHVQGTLCPGVGPFRSTPGPLERQS